MGDSLSHLDDLLFPRCYEKPTRRSFGCCGRIPHDRNVGRSEVGSDLRLCTLTR